MRRVPGGTVVSKESIGNESNKTKCIASYWWSIRITYITALISESIKGIAT